MFVVFGWEGIFVFVCKCFVWVGVRKVCVSGVC